MACEHEMWKVLYNQVCYGGLRIIIFPWNCIICSTHVKCFDFALIVTVCVGLEKEDAFNRRRLRVGIGEIAVRMG